MARNFKVTHPRARLEAQLVVDTSFSRGFSIVRYDHRHTNARWWERTIVATDAQWLRLSGRHGTSPRDTWTKLLNDRDRPPLPLPILVLADFVAHAADYAQPNQWWLFYWVAWALDDLLRFSPLSPSSTGGTSVPPEALLAATRSLVDGLLDTPPAIRWSMSDGTQLQTLVHLGELVWSFPPNLVRRLVNAFVDLDEQDIGHESVARSRQTSSSFIGPGQLVQLSGVYLWRRTHIPQVRQMHFRMPTMTFPALMQQALILTHPDAPPIEDVDLVQLCDGTIGQESDPPSHVQPAYKDVVNLPDFAPAISRARITTYAREVVTVAITLPVGQWEIATTTRFPLFRALDLRGLRVMAFPQGCWVRLLPRLGSWGKVVWWVPQLEPHHCLAFALGTGREHPLVWAVHETMWMLWRDIHVRDASHL